MKIAIVGATGLVGLEMRKVLVQEKKYDAKTLKLFASRARPAEGVMELESSLAELESCDYVLNAATNETAQFLRSKLKPHQVLIDNSSAYRMDPEVPLVVPEVNGDVLESRFPVIANPNCTTILLCVALNAFREAGIQRVVVATYQAASGAGIKALEELQGQIQALGQGQPVPKPEVFPFQIANNVLSHNSSIRGEGRFGEGYNEEECKVLEETRKILNVSHMPLSATCVRVPVMRAHTEAVTIDLKKEMKLEEIRAALAQAPGVKIVDEPETSHFPMPLEAENQDLVYVGRIRKDPVLPKTVHLMLVGDQIRKGAATNAIQIMERIEEIKRVSPVSAQS
jgi:aspartate-semialdehyde dehydrogenase